MILWSLNDSIFFERFREPIEVFFDPPLTLKGQLSMVRSPLDQEFWCLDIRRVERHARFEAIGQVRSRPPTKPLGCQFKSS